MVPGTRKRGVFFVRKPVIAGNWKMYKTVDESIKFLERCIPACKDFNKVKIIVCPTFLSLAPMAEKVQFSNIRLGAQNIYWEKEGAFTGEVSPFSLADLGVNYVIIGHSERRSLFGERDAGVNKKIKAALSFNLKPILCVGESLQEREKGVTREIVEEQLKLDLEGIESQQAEEITIAYEPIWAIGTGRSSSAEDSQEVISSIRGWMAAYFNKNTAEKIPILYGGSVNPENIGKLLEKDDIDGALIGGASLKEDSFVEMVEIANTIY